MSSQRVISPVSELATAKLASFVVNVEYEALPDAAVTAAKSAILDGVANLAAASSHPVASTGRAYIAAMGGTQECTTVGHPERLPAGHAAWVNGLTLHCLDYEVQGFPPCHGTSSLLPGILAVGEKHAGNGRAAVLAFVLGWELQQRTRKAGFSADLGGFHFPGVIGPMAAAAACSRMLSLPEEQVAMAFGVAASRTGGLFANNGTMTKATHPANTSRNAVEAVELIVSGFTASTTVWENQLGYVSAIFGGDFDWSTLLDGLGTSYEIVEPGFSIKRYPAEIYMQWVIEAASLLRDREQFAVEDIVEVTVDPPTLHLDLSRPNPRSGLDGKFSYEYCTAVGLVEPRVRVQSFTDEVRFTPAIDEILGKIRINHGEGHSRENIWAEVTVELADGTRHVGRCDAYRGSIANPMSRSDHEQKVRDCFASAEKSGLADEAIAAVDGLEEEGGLERLIGLIGKL